MSLLVVTAADRPFWRCLYQFLLSAERRRVPENHRVIAYDLGLGEDKLALLRRRFPWCEFRRFDFAAYPPHVSVAAGAYAWKPVLIADLLEETGEAVLWLDSATILKQELGPVEKIIRETGIMSLRGAMPLGLRAHPDTVALMEAPPEILHRRERVGGVNGFDPAFPTARRLARDWRAWSLRPDAILPDAPLPAHLAAQGARHMWDQTVLSILLLTAEHRGEIALPDQDIDISSPTPMRWMSSRNKVKPDLPLWRDPLTRLSFALWKFADQRLIALDRWKRTRLWGFERWLREDYIIHLRAEGRRAIVRDKSWGYFADPFLWRRDGKLYLFVEQFRYAINKARIVCLEIGEDLSAGPPVPVLDLPVHASFPFLVERDGALFMMPETARSLSVDLWVCERFPDRWRLARRLLYGFEAVDSVLFPWDGRWWLLTLARDHEADPRHLRIYFTDDPLTGAWQPHPINDQRLYADAPCGSYRNAGAPFVRDGSLYRPVQMSRRHYGEGAALMRIDRLTPTEFAESPAESELPSLRTHHVTHAGDVTAWDHRDRAF